MEGTEQAHSQIIINGQEFSPEDATRYIDLGRKYSEMESKLNTSLDKVYPEYTKATQRLKELEADAAEKARLLEDYQTKEKQAAIPEDRQAALKAARDMGLADQDYLKEQGYMTRKEVEEFLNTKQSQQQLVDNTLKQAGVLEREIDGSDGRVPFSQKAVLAYAATYQINDLRQAYEEMNEGGNARWKAAQIEKEQRPGLTTIKPGGKKSPQKAKITDDNFKDAWNELYGNE